MKNVWKNIAKEGNHTHTHTHTHREREREKGRKYEVKSTGCSLRRPGLIPNISMVEP
jgi:hypothetical protein